MTDKNNTSTPKKYELVNFCEFDKFAEKSYCAIHGVDSELNLGDITKVDETQLKPFNMICGGSPCFVKGTNILTNTGYKEIENIKVGDVVYTKDGNWKKVLRVGSDGEKSVYQLSAMGILPLICTSNHPFWVRNKTATWNNDLRRYEYSFDTPKKLHLSDMSCERKLRSYIGIPIIKDRYNDLYTISDELLWLAGRYVADGHISEGIVLSIGKSKIDDFKDVKLHYRKYKNTQSCYRIVFNKTSELYDIITRYNFGNHAINKTIPIEFLELPKEKLKVFLDGYMRGDGCTINENKISQATTMSRSLAETLVLAVQKVYNTGCRIYFTSRPDKYIIENREVNQHDTYMIRFMNYCEKQSYFVDEECIWYPIKKIEEYGKSVIYNIEVADDHTYIANGAMVFNCQDFSVAGKQVGSRWVCKHCVDNDGNPYEYNPLTVHYSQRDKCPKCGSTDIDKSRSSLLVEWLRVIRANKPAWGIYENVKNIVGKKFKETFDMFVNELHEYGYNTYFQVLNAKNYGIPQNRERVYLIIIKKELDNGKFTFPKGFDNGLRLKDILEDEVDEKFYINTPKAKELIDDLISSGKLNKEVSNTVRAGGEVQ